MDRPSLLRSRLRLLAIYLFAWAALIVIFACQSYAMSSLKGESMTFENSLLWVMADYIAWAVIAPIPLLFAHHFPIGRHGLPRTIASYLAVYGVTLVCHAGVYLAVDRALGIAWRPDDPFMTMWGLYIVKKAAFDVLMFITLVGLMHGLSYYRLYREREVQAARLTAQLAESRLNHLSAQLQPHFLFNTLNTISALVRSDPDGADRVVSRLGDLLRLSLQRDGVQCVTVREELAFLDPYIEIQRTRFQDRLTVTINAAPEVQALHVPSLLLQPLVENAVKHGLEPKAGAVRIDVTIRPDGDRLLLEVCDDGHGVAAEGPGREGIGLGNTRARLAELYGPRAELTIAPRASGGCCVRVLIPRAAPTGPVA